MTRSDDLSPTAFRPSALFVLAGLVMIVSATGIGFAHGLQRQGHDPWSGHGSAVAAEPQTAVAVALGDEALADARFLTLPTAAQPIAPEPRRMAALEAPAAPPQTLAPPPVFVEPAPLEVPAIPADSEPQPASAAA